jgi:hypothetical protein
MAAENHRTIIVVAIIGLLGTLGGAVITNWDKMFPARTPSAADNLVAPHAPPIEINQSFKIWGEDTIQMDLQPGGTKTLKAMELYANWATYPSSSCAGPGLVPYTWQVRVPYPRGGDLEIRRVLMGGSTEQVGLGSMGRATMGYCEEHTFKNNGTESIQVEVRYASAADESK